MKYALLIFFHTLSLVCLAQSTKPSATNWRMALDRADGKQVIFQLEKITEQGKPELYVVNGGEKIKMAAVQMVSDSLFFDACI